jgi:hypothetical protein
MPGVVSASSDLTDSIPLGDVHFWLSVEVAEDVTADQVAALTARYLDGLRSADYSGYQTELDVHRGWALFAVDSGQRRVDNADQIVGQARDWVALRREFRGATVKLRSAVVHPTVAAPTDADRGHPVLGSIEFPDAADYSAVSAAVTTLGERFPQLAGGTWTLEASKAHPASIASSQRLPSAAELGVWNALNADQAIPHVDTLTVNGPQLPAVWVSEQTNSHDPAVALQLAADHLPMVAALPRPSLYTATDQPQARRDFYGRTTAAVAVTVGGCTVRSYRPTPDEQRLIDGYENCRR